MIKYKKRTYYTPEEIVKKFSNIDISEIYTLIFNNSIMWIGGGVLGYLVKKELDSKYYIRKTEIVNYLSRRL